MKIQEELQITLEDMTSLYADKKREEERDAGLEKEIDSVMADESVPISKRIKKAEGLWIQRRDCSNIIAGIDKRIQYETTAFGLILNFIAKGNAND